MAYDKVLDADLVKLDVSHLFNPSITKIGYRRGTFLRGYMYDFLEWFAPHLTRQVVDEAYRCGSKAELDQLFSHVEIPTS
jgi:LysR family cys regulon transcriptional activator